MSWTLEKEKAIGDLIRERSQVELNHENIKAWGLTEPYFVTILKNITDEEKQKILNDLLDAKKPILEKLVIDKTGELNAIDLQIKLADSMSKN